MSTAQARIEEFFSIRRSPEFSWLLLAPVRSFPAMPAYPIRHFALIDAMILVVAAGLGLAGIRAELTRHIHCAASFFPMPVDPLPVPEDLSRVINTNWRPWNSVKTIFSPMPETKPGLTRFAAPSLAALSLAMLVIRFRPSRPSWSRLLRQPGFVASLGATVALGILLILTLFQFLLVQIMATGQAVIPSPGPEPSLLSSVACQTIQPRLAGVVVLTGWVILALGGRCRRERGWIDWGGIIVGLGWVSLLLLDCFAHLGN